MNMRHAAICVLADSYQALCDDHSAAALHVLVQIKFQPLRDSNQDNPKHYEETERGT